MVTVGTEYRRARRGARLIQCIFGSCAARAWQRRALDLTPRRPGGADPTCAGRVWSSCMRLMSDQISWSVIMIWCQAKLPEPAETRGRELLTTFNFYKLHQTPWSDPCTSAHISDLILNLIPKVGVIWKVDHVTRHVAWPEITTLRAQRHKRLVISGVTWSASSTFQITQTLEDYGSVVTYSGNSVDNTSCSNPKGLEQKEYDLNSHE